MWDCNVSANLKIPSPAECGGRDRAEVLAEAFVNAIAADFDVPSYGWIGFSILSDVLPTALAVVELFRRRYPNAVLLAGNHEATVNIQDCIGKSQLNGIILGDAELPMLALMRGEEPSRVQGVVWRTYNPKPSREQFESFNDALKWNEIPFEAYWNRTRQLYDWSAMSDEERLDKEYEIATVRIHSLVACELACTFCSVKNTRRIASGSNKPSIINLAPDALARNLLAIKKCVPGAKTIYDSCDEAWLGRGRGEEYCAVLESVKPQMDAGLPRGLRYLVQVRTNDLTESLVHYAARVGVKHLTIGVESPVEQVRRDMMKPQREQHVRDAIRWMTSVGINAYCLFLLFYPTITLEQLREAVENFRIYMSLGATISIEPFAMAYVGTDLYDDPELLLEYAGYDIPFSGTPAKRLKWATLIWPRDERVRAVQQWFRENVDDYIAAALKRENTQHAFKGRTGKVIVDVLEEALRLWDAGKIPPWRPIGAGKRSKVYQDYGDQMSGAEIAEAAKSGMIRANKTATRFNSTHALLDDSANAGIKSRIKDPAYPAEMVRLPAVRDEDEGE